MRDTTDVDRTTETSGLTRQDLLRRAAVGGGALLVGGNLAQVAQGATVAAPKPKRGGTFRIGVSGGSAKDFIDGQNIVTTAGPGAHRHRLGDAGRRSTRSSSSRSTVSPRRSTANKKADVWTIRVHDGIEFHNGKTLGADDVIYSLKRLINPKLGLFGGAALPSLDPKRIKKLDKRTVRLTLKQADGTILDALGQYIAGIVPVGYSPNAVGKAKPEHRHGPVQAAELHARPAERARAQPELLAHAGSRTSTRS